MPRSKAEKLKPFPHLRSDEEMERFVETADLSEYDFSQFKPIRTFFKERKNARVNMRLPESLLNKVKSMALEEKVPYQRLMRDLIETGIEHRQARDTKPAARKKAS